MSPDRKNRQILPVLDMFIWRNTTRKNKSKSSSRTRTQFVSLLEGFQWREYGCLPMFRTALVFCMRFKHSLLYRFPFACGWFCYLNDTPIDFFRKRNLKICFLHELQITIILGQIQLMPQRRESRSSTDSPLNPFREHRLTFSVSTFKITTMVEEYHTVDDTPLHWAQMDTEENIQTNKRLDSIYSWDGVSFFLDWSFNMQVKQDQNISEIQFPLQEWCQESIYLFICLYDYIFKYMHTHLARMR